MLMKHELHGLQDAVGGDIETMKKNGWIEYGYDNFYKDVAKKQQLKDNPVQSKDENEGEKAIPSGNPAKRRGRPPRGD